MTIDSNTPNLFTSRFKRLLPLAIIVVIPPILYWRLIFAGEVLYWGLPLYQFYPWHALVVEAIRAGDLPLWTDLLGNGAPLLANHQSAVFYPLNLIYFVMPVEHAMGYSVALHLVLAGLFAYGWGQTIGLSRFGAVVTGLSFMVGGFFVSRTQFITIVNGAAWLPLLFLLAERLVRRRTLTDAAWLGMAMALQFLAGHAQVWFYSLWALGAYALVRAWTAGRKRLGGGVQVQRTKWRQVGRILALLAGALVLALGLSAIQLLPTAELALNSQRADGLSLDEAMTYSFWPWRLLTLAIPNLFGSPATGDYWGYATYWEDTGYIGVLPLLLALGAVWHWVRGLRREKEATSAQTKNSLPFVPFLLAVTLISLILAMGHNTPVYPFFFKYVPGFGAFRAPARFLLLYTFGASTLAGIGADHFRLTYRVQYVSRLTVAGAGAMLAVSLALGQASGQLALGIKPTFAPAIACFALGMSLSAILVLLHGRSPGDPDLRVAHSPLTANVWQVLIVCFIVVDLALFAAPLTPTIASALYQSTTQSDSFLLARADSDRLFSTYDYNYNIKFNGHLDFSDWGSSDLAYWLSFRETLVPNLNIFSRTSSVNNDEPLVVGRWGELMDVLRSVDWPDRLHLLRMMNVGYVLSDSLPPGLLPVENVAHLYRLSESLPRVWVVPHAQVIASSDDLLAELTSPSFDPAAEVLLESAAGLPGQTGAVGPLSTSDSQLSPATISLQEDWNCRTIDLVVSQPGYLVLAYTYYPGWRATVDGRPIEILRANYMFMALPLEAGEHQIVLRYRPVSFMLGALISSLSVLAVLGIALLSAIRKSAK